MPTKTDRVWRFHQNTLEALQELVQAAGLDHPDQITADHIVRRMADNDVRLLANQLFFAEPGSLLAAMDGSGAWPHNVFKLYWPLAQAASFQPANGGKLMAGKASRSMPTQSEAALSAKAEPTQAAKAESTQAAKAESTQAAKAAG